MRFNLVVINTNKNAYESYNNLLYISKKKIKKKHIVSISSEQ